MNVFQWWPLLLILQLLCVRGHSLRWYVMCKYHLLLEELALFRVTFETGSLEPLEVVKLLRKHLADNDNVNQVHQIGFETNYMLGSCLHWAFEPRSHRPLTSSGSGSGTIYWHIIFATVVVFRASNLLSYCGLAASPAQEVFVSDICDEHPDSWLVLPQC